MKRFILSGLIFTTMGITIISCNKERVQVNKTIELNKGNIIDHNMYPEISVQDEVLTFSTIEYYESIVSNESENFSIDELTQYLNTTDFKNYGKKFGQDSEYDDPFMDVIMNEEKIVKIGEWFIYVDLPSETVLAISENEENAYTSLLNKSGRNIREFNIGDDVLDHLANNTSPEDRSCGGISGGSYPAYSDNSYGQIIGSVGGTTIRLNTGVKFFRAGIYYRLSSLYELWPNVSGLNGLFNINVQVKGPEGWRKKRPCNSGSIGTIPQNTITINSSNVNGQATFYSGTRNLNGFYFFVRARCTNCGTDWTSYGGRNINSPY